MVVSGMKERINRINQNIDVPEREKKERGREAKGLKLSVNFPGLTYAVLPSTSGAE
jgi:hypothetical protein